MSCQRQHPEAARARGPTALDVDGAGVVPAALPAGVGASPVHRRNFVRWSNIAFVNK